MLLRTSFSSILAIKGFKNCSKILFSGMASIASSISVAPPVHRLKPGEAFDRDWFRKSISVIGLKLPASRTSEFMKAPALTGLVFTQIFGSIYLATT
jgi:hypothetical protein